MSLSQQDLTTKARIRDAALARFPESGFGSTTIRAIAKDASVSPGLVLHYFESKEGLREACDHYVVQMFRETKIAAMEEENLLDPGFAAYAYQVSQPILRYFAWALSRGHRAADDLFDEMLQEAVRISRIAIEKGMIVESPDLEARTAAQMAMHLGMIVMHTHIERNLGIDLLTAEGLATFTPVLLEIFGGLFNPQLLDRLKETYGDEAVASMTQPNTTAAE
ncbi:MAG: TetR family transcriptional regulator [Acidimicrobiia bacterium]